MHTLNVKRWTFIMCAVLTLAVAAANHKEHAPKPVAPPCGLSCLVHK